MTAAVVLEHEASHIDIAGAVQYTVAHSSRTSGTAAAADNPSGDILLRIHAVYHETVACVDRVNTA